MLWGLSAMPWDIFRFRNESLVSFFQAQVDYTCWKDSLPNFWQHFWKMSMQTTFGVHFPFCF